MRHNNNHYQQTLKNLADDIRLEKVTRPKEPINRFEILATLTFFLAYLPTWAWGLYERIIPEPILILAVQKFVAKAHSTGESRLISVDDWVMGDDVEPYEYIGPDGGVKASYLKQPEGAKKIEVNGKTGILWCKPSELSLALMNLKNFERLPNGFETEVPHIVGQFVHLTVAEYNIPMGIATVPSVFNTHRPIRAIFVEDEE